MFKTTLKGLLGHKLRLVTTMAAIVVGVAFMAGTLVLTSTLNQAFRDVFAATSKGTDALVRSSQVITVQGNEQRQLIDTSVVEAVKSTPGVAYAEGNIGCACAQIIGKDGKKIGGGGPPTLGFNYADDPRLNPFVVTGDAPRGPDQVVIDKGTADKAGFVIGDKVKFLIKGAPAEMTMVGIAKVGDNDSLLGATTALFDRPTAERLLSEPGKVANISAVAADGVSQQQLVDNLKTTLPPGAEAITGQAYTDEQVKNIEEGFLTFFNTFLIVFALIALFVGSFIIYNTFSIIVAQRTREMALLRAVGASRRQVLGSVILESVVVGTVASFLGLGFGVLFAAGLQKLLAASGFGIPSIPPVITASSMITAFIMGMVITMGAAIFPARRAAKVPPIAAIRDVSVDRTGVSVKRIVSGLIITGLGIGAIFLGLLTSIENAATVVGLGAALTFVGVAVLGPILAKPVAGLLGAPVEAIRGVSGRLARENSTRNPKRTSSTAAALMIGVALVAFITILASSIKTSFSDSLDQDFKADLIVDSGSFDGSNTLSPTIAEELRKRPELSAVSELRFGVAEINGTGEFLLGVNPNVGDFINLDPQGGSLSELGPNAIAVDKKLAEEKGWKVGDTLPAKFADVGAKDLRIVALTDAAALQGSSYVAGIPLFQQNYTTQGDVQVMTKIAPGTPVDQARKAVEQVTAPYANATVQDIAQYKQTQLEFFDQLLGLVYALLFLAIFIAILGIVSTLSLSIFERTRELGLLRAVGMTRRQVRSTVRWESVIIALFGTLLGIVIGIFFGWALMTAIASAGDFGALTIPVGQLLVIVVLAILVGIGAAVWPGFRASRLDVLEAISTE